LTSTALAASGCGNQQFRRGGFRRRRRRRRRRKKFHVGLLEKEGSSGHGEE